MISYQVKIAINQSTEKIFAAISDYQSTHKWITGLQKIEPLSGTPGESGFKSKYTFEENGRTVIFHEEVLQVKPNESMQYRMESDSIVLNSEIYFKNISGRTEILMLNQAKGKTFFMKLMLPLFKGMMRKRHEQDFAKFKALVENPD